MIPYLHAGVHANEEEEMNQDQITQIKKDIVDRLKSYGVPCYNLHTNDSAGQEHGWFQCRLDVHPPKDDGSDLHYFQEYPIEWAETYPKALIELFAMKAQITWCRSQEK